MEKSSDVRRVREQREPLYVEVKEAILELADVYKRQNILITNGTIDTGALEMMEKDEGWLKNELHKRGYESYKDIFFAEWNELIDDERGKAGELYIVERTEKRD